MIRHDTFLELAAVAIDFELTPSERSRLEAHLATCPACLRSAGALLADARSLAALPVTRLSERRADAILGSLLRPVPSIRPTLRLLAVAALLAVLAVGSILVGAELLRQRDDPLVVVPPVPSPTAPTWASATVPASDADGRWEILVHGVAVGRTGRSPMGGSTAAMTRPTAGSRCCRRRMAQSGRSCPSEEFHGDRGRGPDEWP